MTANLHIDGVTVSDLAARVKVDGVTAKVRVDGALCYEYVPVAAPDITGSPAMPDGVSGAFYSYTPVNTGGAVVSWSATGLPGGTSINTSTGKITGTPFVTGTFAVEITATNGTGSSVFSDSVDIAASVTPPNITGSAAFVTGYAGIPFSWTPTNSGGGATSYVLQAGVLPTGLSLNPVTGAITGTPTTIQTQAITVRAINSAGTSDFSGSIVIQRALTDTLPVSLSHLAIGGLCEINFARMGTWSSIANISGNPNGSYLNPTGLSAGDSFEIYIATPTLLFGSGSYTFAPGFNAWHTLNTNRNLQVSTVESDSHSVNVAFQIREIANPANIISFDIDMTIIDLITAP